MKNVNLYPYGLHPDLDEDLCNICGAIDCDCDMDYEISIDPYFEDIDEYTPNIDDLENSKDL